MTNEDEETVEEKIKTDETKEETSDKTEKEEKPSEEECDPMTMDCRDMPDEIEKLIRKEITLEDKLAKLGTLSHAIPEKKEIFKSIDEELNAEKEKIETTINDITTRFASCRPPLNEDESEDEDE